MEVNEEKDATEEVEKIVAEVDALVAARGLDIKRAEQIGRVGLGLNVDKLSSAELKRDILLYAREYPEEFLSVLGDPMLELQAQVHDFFVNNLLSWVNNKDVYFNLKSNKKKMLTVPFGESRDFIVGSYLKSDDGIEILKLLEKNLNTLVEV